MSSSIPAERPFIHLADIIEEAVESLVDTSSGARTRDDAIDEVESMIEDIFVQLREPSQ